MMKSRLQKVIRWTISFIDPSVIRGFCAGYLWSLEMKRFISSDHKYPAQKTRITEGSIKLMVHRITFCSRDFIICHHHANSELLFQEFSYCVEIRYTFSQFMRDLFFWQA